MSVNVEIRPRAFSTDMRPGWYFIRGAGCGNITEVDIISFIAYRQLHRRGCYMYIPCVHSFSLNA